MEQIELTWHRRIRGGAAWEQVREVLILAVILFKLRIVALLLLAAVGGAALGALDGGAFTAGRLVLLLSSGGLAAAGSSGLNQWLERERDRAMTRTRQRPLPAGRVQHASFVLGLSLLLVALGVGLALVFSLSLAFFVAAGALIYVGVYTIWLKPRTLLNIVIGGAAGSCAVLSGGAAAGAWSAPGTWLLAALLFAWTPVHFWSLALAYREDYASAGFPMLPARTTPARAARWIAFHTGLTALLALILGLWPVLSPVYLLLALPATLLLAVRTRQLLACPERTAALSLFHVSNSYLTVVLVAVLLTLFL